MILRELFEARAKSVGIIFGRFNPPHMGHMKAWEMASENPSWYVGTNKSTEGPKDPLPFDIKVKAMQAVYPEIRGHIVAEQSWLTLASKVYEKHGNIVLNVYTDEDWVTKALVQYNGKEGAHGYYEFGTIQQQPTPRLSSATALRAAVAADDRDAFGQAAGVDPNTLIAGHPFFDVVKHYLMPHAEKAAAKVAKKKVKEPVAENNSMGTMPTTDYVKSIYAAAAENGMGAPDVEAVRKQMILAPNGEVDIMATMQKALQVFQSPKFKQLLADLDALVKKAEAQQGISSGINELSNELLGRYKKAAGADAKKADAEGDYARGNKRFSGIVKATKKQFDNDEKGVAEVSKDTLDRYVTKAVDAHGHADFAARQSKNDPTKRSYHVDQKKTAEKRRQGISRALDRMSKDDVSEGAPIVVAQAPIDVRNPKKAPQPYRNQGDIVPPTNPPSTEKRGVKGRPGQRPMPKYDESTVAENAWDRLQREKALEAAGVGIITKQNTTVDVNKNTPKKNLKAFRLI